MTMITSDPTVWAKYYERVNYGGDHGDVVLHGDVRQISNNDGTWIKNSRSNGVNGLSMLTITEVDINNPAQIYRCHLEDYSANEILFL